MSATTARDSSSITFRGTAKVGLEVTDHYSFRNVVHNIDELIRGTDPFRNTFVGDPYNEDDPDTKIPKVVLIRGTDIDSFQAASVLRTNYGLVGVALTAWNTHRSLILRVSWSVSTFLAYSVMIIFDSAFSNYCFGFGRQRNKMLSKA